MPEASMDKHDRFAACHYNVRPALQPLDVKPVADVKFPEGPSYLSLGEGVLPANTAHILSPLWRYVGHLSAVYRYHLEAAFTDLPWPI
jgi:hypothetical protein